MAKALSKLTDRYQSQTFVLALLPVKKITAYTCGLVLTGTLTTAGSLFCAQASLAADFTHAQHVFVPPTSIPRHYDTESLNYGNATGDSPDIYPSTGMPSTNGATIKTTTQNGKSFSKTFYDGRSPQSQTGQTASSPSNTDAPGAMNAFVTQARIKAQALVKQGKLAAAENMLQTDLKAVPKSQGLKTELANVRVARARFALKNGNSSAANEYAESALAVQPSNPAAKQILAQTAQQTTTTTNSVTEHLSRAKEMLSQDDVTGANREIQAALRIKNTAEVRSSMGDLAAKQGNVLLAKAEYAKALQLDPNSVTALRQSGLFKVSQSDLVGANKDLSRALFYDSKDKEAGAALQKIWHEQIAKNPLSTNAHLGLARAYQLSDELSLAQVEYKEVVRLEPQHPSIPAARQSFKLALAKQESVKCLQAAKTLEDAGALTEAHQKAIEAVNISPTCVSARIYQGTISEKLKLYSEAHEAFMTALRYDPKNAIAARHLRSLQGLVATAEGTASGIGSAAASASNIPSTPNVPPGMYVFRGWQYGHPLANNANNGSAASTPSYTGTTDASQVQNQNYQGQGYPATGQAQVNSTSGYGATQNASYSGSSMNPAAVSALAAGTAFALPGGASTAQLADPAAPMPLQGTPPVASSTTAHVNAFSSFLGSLRELQVNQKQQSQQAESLMSSALNTSGSGLSGAGLSTGGLSSSNAGSLGSTGLASAMSAGAAPLPAVSTPSSSSISSILAQAQAAIAGAGGTSSTSSATTAGASGASAGQSSSVNTSVNAVPVGAAGSTSTASGAGNSGQSMSDAAWDAAPAWVKQKFPNMTQADFVALAGKARGTLRSRLQALAAQQKAASAGQALPPTADDALAGLLPPGVTVAQLTAALNNAAPGSSATVLANLMPPSTVTTAADIQGEQDLIAKAGQDAPTTPPPDVVPTEAVVQTTVVLKAKTGNSNSPSGSATTAIATSASTVGVGSAQTATDLGTSAAGSGQPVGTSIGTSIGTSEGTSEGLTAETPALAIVPPVSSLRPAINSATTGSTTTTSTQSSAALPSRDDLNNDNSNASVVLELQGYSPTPTGIKLKVVIKNSRTQSLPLPDSARAVIHMPGQADKEARVTFSAKEVFAGGVVQGVIKVPGHDLNPSADLVLPNFLPTAFADRDVHLTVPISALIR